MTARVADAARALAGDATLLAGILTSAHASLNAGVVATKIAC